MTPNSLKASEHPFIEKFVANGISNLSSTTVMPSVTLPCHMSLFHTDFMLTDNAIKYANDKSPDFLFLYLGTTDETGHEFGWMTKEYIKAVYNAWSCIEKVQSNIPEKYKIIVMADHGGHDFSHGTELPSDMTIPIIINGIPADRASSKIKSANIIDIAPTVAKLIGIKADKDWKGQSLICRIIPDT